MTDRIQKFGTKAGRREYLIRGLAGPRPAVKPGILAGEVREGIGTPRFAAQSDSRRGEAVLGDSQVWHVGGFSRARGWCLAALVLCRAPLVFGLDPSTAITQYHQRVWNESD